MGVGGDVVVFVSIVAVVVELELDVMLICSVDDAFR